MVNLNLFPRAPVVDPNIEPPARGNSVQSQETSRQGARKIATHVYECHKRMCVVYGLKGTVTDAEMADLLQVERTTINARRSELIKMGLVDKVPKGTRKNPKTGVSNSTWGLLETQR